MLTPDGDKQTSPGRAQINGVPASPGDVILSPLFTAFGALLGTIPAPHSEKRLLRGLWVATAPFRAPVRSAPGWGWCFSPEERRARAPGAESRWGSTAPGRPRTRTRTRTRARARGWRRPRGVLPAAGKAGSGIGALLGATAVSPRPQLPRGARLGPAGAQWDLQGASGGEARTARGGWKLSFAWRGRRGARGAGRLGHCPQRVHFCQAGVGCYSEEGRGEREEGEGKKKIPDPKPNRGA